MSNLFQSSAKASSVESNTIKVENAAEGILREGQATLKKMSKRMKAEEAASTRHIGHLEKKFIAEQKDRERTRKWEMELSKSFIDAVKYNHKVKIDDATNAVKNVNKGALSELAELAPSIAGVWDKIDAKREKDGKAFGQMLHFKYGINAQDYGDQQGIRGHLKEKAGANNALRNKMRERGASWSEIEQASRLNGYERLGLHEGIAIRGGRDYGSWENTQRTKVFELGNGLGRHSLASATHQVNGEALAAVNQRLLSEYTNLPQFQGIDTTLFVTHAREKILRHQSRSTTELNEKSEGIIQENQEKVYQDQLYNAITTDGPAGYFDHINTISGGDKANRAWAVSIGHEHLMKMAKDGRLTNDFINKLDRHEFMPGVRYGERNYKKIDELVKAKNQHDEEKYEAWSKSKGASSLDKKLKSVQLEQALMNRWEEVTNDELMSYFKMAAGSGGTGGNKPMMDMLQRLMKTSVESINDTANVPYLEKLLANNLLTRKAVIAAGLTPATEIEWMKKAKENDQFVPDDETDSLFESTAKTAIEGILESYGVEGKHVLSSKLAAAVAHKDMRQYYKQGLMKFEGNKEAAQALALQMFQADLKANDKYHITERTTINGQLHQKPHFTKHHLPAQRIVFPTSEYTTEMVRNDPDMWKTTQMTDPAVAVQWVKDANAGRVKGFPADALYICEKFGWNILEFLDKQAQLTDPDLELDKKWHAISSEAHSRVRPEYLPFLKEGPVGVSLSFKLSQVNSLHDPSVLSPQAKELMGVA